MLQEKRFLRKVDSLFKKKFKNNIRRKSQRSLRQNTNTLYNKLGSFNEISISDSVNPLFSNNRIKLSYAVNRRRKEDSARF